MGIHDGHRERLKGRFFAHGLENFNELNALELLLFFAIPRRDTNVIAHGLLDKFGSLSAVFDASVQELKEVDGVGDNAAALIRLVPQIMKLAEVTKAAKIKRITDVKSAAEFLKPQFMNEPDEIFILVCLDSRKNIISSKVLARGVVNAVDLKVRMVIESALKARATSVIIAHNHPDGDCMPSAEDDMSTKQLIKSLSSVGLEFYDHLIFSGNEYISYRKAGILQLYGNMY